MPVYDANSTILYVCMTFMQTNSLPDNFDKIISMTVFHKERKMTQNTLHKPSHEMSLLVFSNFEKGVLKCNNMLCQNWTFILLTIYLNLNINGWYDVVRCCQQSRQGKDKGHHDKYRLSHINICQTHTS